MNAGDPSSTAGNKIKSDRSLEGAYGKSALIHLIHALRSVLAAENIPWVRQSG